MSDTDDASFDTLRDAEVAFVNLRGEVNAMGNKLSSLEQRVDDALEEDETDTELQEVRTELRILRNEVDGLAGLAENEKSTKAKRASDLRQKLVQLARNKAELKDRDTLSRDYNGVRDILETLGHGPIYDWQAYDAMKDAADADGFAYVERDQGNDVIRVKLSGIASQPASMQNNRAAGGDTASETTEQGGASSGD